MAKAKISISLETELIAWLDQQIRDNKFRNRSHAFESALSTLKKEIEGK